MTLAERYATSVINAVAPSITLTKGEGAVVFDDTGVRYLDFLSGIAVNILGHAHPAIVEAVTDQISTIGHVSNLFGNRPATLLAERLLALAGCATPGKDGRVFYANSGAGANEAAFKISRRTGRTRIVSTLGSFHGRTMGALALTGQPEKAGAFSPLPGEVVHLPYGDVSALRAAVTEETAMVILEPIQGESGIVVPPPGYLRAAREITEGCGALLALDEVQTGIGRTGRWFAHQAEDIRPDVITLAKGVGGGLPLGVCLAMGPAAGLLQPGDHQSTFGGNPVCCAAALAVIDTIENQGLLSRVTEIEARVRSGVQALNHPLVSEVRGAGVMLGIALTAPVSSELNAALTQRGFLTNAVRPSVLRLAPPMVISDDHIDAFLAALPEALDAAAGTTRRTP